MYERNFLSLIRKNLIVESFDDESFYSSEFVQ